MGKKKNNRGSHVNAKGKGKYLKTTTLYRFKCTYRVHLFYFFFFFFFHFLLFRAAPMAHGSSQAMGGVTAAASVLHRSHSNLGSEPCLQPTAQLIAMPDP